MSHSEESQLALKSYNGLVDGMFDERQRGLIRNSLSYALGDTYGLPGHNLMLIIEKYDYLLNQFAYALIHLGDEECQEAIAAIVEGYKEHNG